MSTRIRSNRRGSSCTADRFAERTELRPKGLRNANCHDSIALPPPVGRRTSTGGALWVVANPPALHTDHMTGTTTVITFVTGAAGFMAACCSWRYPLSSPRRAKRGASERHLYVVAEVAPGAGGYSPDKPACGFAIEKATDGGRQ